jgi:hypothetical protein
MCACMHVFCACACACKRVYACPCGSEDVINHATQRRKLTAGLGATAAPNMMDGKFSQRISEKTSTNIHF